MVSVGSWCVDSVFGNEISDHWLVWVHCVVDSQFGHETPFHWLEWFVVK